MRLVQWCERCKLVEYSQDMIINENRRAEVGATMDNAVPHRGKAIIAPIVVYPRQKLREERFVTKACTRVPITLTQDMPACIDGTEARRRSDARDFPLCRKDKRPLTFDFEQCKF